MTLLVASKLIAGGRGLAAARCCAAPRRSRSTGTRARRAASRRSIRGGRRIGVFLPRGAIVRGGDVLVGEDGSLIAVAALDAAGARRQRAARRRAARALDLAARRVPPRQPARAARGAQPTGSSSSPTTSSPSCSSAWASTSRGDGARSSPRPAPTTRRGRRTTTSHDHVTTTTTTTTTTTITVTITITAHGRWPRTRNELRRATRPSDGARRDGAAHSRRAGAPTPKRR